MANEDLRVRIEAQIRGLDQVESLKNAVRQLQSTAAPASADLQKLKNAAMQLGSATDRTESDLRRSISALKDVRAQLSLTDREYRQLTSTINKYQAQLDKATGAQQRGGRFARIGETVGAVAASGVFGGPEGLIGAGIGAFFGPGGALAGGAIGAQAGLLRQQISGTADYVAQIDRLKIALKGVTQGAQEYEDALTVIDRATKTFNITKDEAISGFTRLTASVVGAGGKVRDAELVFNGVSNAIRATGGSAEDVQGALIAMAQVFSKGKATAEEIQGQLGERLPGAVTLFAEATGRTGAELAKAFEQGTVGLNDVMKFVIALGDRFQATNDKIAASSEAAGDRMKVAFGSLREEIGRTFQPLGAAIQDASAELAQYAANAIKAARNSGELNDALREARANSTAYKQLQQQIDDIRLSPSGSSVLGDPNIDMALQLKPILEETKALQDRDTQLQASITRLYEAEGAVNTHTKALLASGKSLEEQGKTIGAAEGAMAVLEGRLNTLAVQNRSNTKEAEFYRAKVAELKTVLDSVKGVYKAKIEIQQIFKGQGAQVNRAAKTSIPEGYRVVAGKLAYQVPGVGWVDAQTGKPVFGGTTPDRGQSNFPSPSGSSGDKVREKLADLAQKREESLFNAREQYEERIAEIRRSAIEQVQQLERQFGDERRNIERDIARTRREIAAAQSDNQFTRRVQLGEDPGLVDAERGIDQIVRRAEEERIRIQEEYSDKELQRTRTIADFQKGVADQINKANQEYAKQIGKIQRDYAINSAKIVERGTGAAGKQLEKSAQISALYLQRGSLNAYVGSATGTVVAEPGQGGTAGRSAEEFLRTLSLDRSILFRVSTIQELDRRIQQLLGQVQRFTPPAAPVSPASRQIPVSQQFDLPGSAGLASANAQQRETRLRQVDVNVIEDVEKRFLAISDESTRQVQTLRDQNILIGLQAKYLQDGVTSELAQQLAQLEQSYETRKRNLESERDAAINKGLNAQVINDFYAEQLDIVERQYEVTVKLTEEYAKQQELLRFRQDNRIGLGLREGAQEYVESIGTMREATAQLAQNGIKGVEDAIFSLMTTGTANFKEFAAEILKQTTRMIIQQMILRVIMQAIGAIPGGGGGLNLSGANALSTTKLTPGGIFAKGGTFGPDGIMPFAMGGIVTKPTLFKFANGGVPRTGLMGEAGPEAIIPLKRGRDGKLGVAGGGNSTNVTVNVDASGSSVQGNAGQGEALGRAISQAVQQELIKQRRPGGLLAA